MRNIEKHEKGEMHTLGPGIWHENWKKTEIEKHQLDYLKNDEITEKMKNEKCTLQDLEYGEKTENQENEKYTL